MIMTTRITRFAVALATSLAAFASAISPARAGGPIRINVETANSALKLFVAPEDSRLYELGYGAAKENYDFPKKLNRQEEFYPQYGDGFISQPALQITHADGNTSTSLAYVKRETSNLDPDIALTKIELKDPAYPLVVTLCLKAYRDEDVIEQWSEIRHEEPAPITMLRYHSAAPAIKAKDYFLTQFQGDYKREATLAEEKLTPGIKVLDSKIGVRATRYRIPSVIISLDGPAQEETGETFGASLCWSGSFSIEAELDWQNRLRLLAGINPVGQQYRLKPKETFKTPGVLWTWSDKGKGQVSRNFHRWAKKYGIRDGDKPRPILFNNWEATHTDFDDAKIVSLFDGAKDLGVELFLLDDGWFGNKHPRDNDRAGLGDWEVNRKKLPQGLEHLADEAKKRGLGFGIWIEPEMVNPQSELFEAHRDWAIVQRNREPELSRYQLVLDLTRPDVQQHAWKSIAGPVSTRGVSYVKWDANRYVTQPGSSYLPPDEQTHLMVDYNRALLALMSRMAKDFPDVMAMACAGGGGRTDYGTLKHFHSFWPSDNTDPRDRVKIQWGFGHFFPAATIGAHVTAMGNRPPKFACDVALSGAFGVDRDVSKMSAEERRAITNAIALYKSTLRQITSRGDLYRLESPYDGPRAALDYVMPDASKAALFVYQLADGEAKPVKPCGLDPKRRYTVRELNVAADSSPSDAKSVDGAALLRDGIPVPCRKEFDSAIFEISEAK